MLNPFSVLTSKVFLATTIAAAAFAATQTVRIEGVGCTTPKPGEKPVCLLRGFKQDVQVIRIDLEAAEVRGFSERMAHRQTKMNYAAAQADAAKAEAVRIARVKADQQEITDEVATDFQRRLADARTRAGQLRDNPNARTGVGSATDDRRVPAAGDAAGRADAAPGEDGLPANDGLIATEQAIQLDSLITWIERQRSVPVNDGDAR